MKKRMISLVVAAVLLIGCLGIPVLAADAPSAAPILRASGKFNVSVQAGKISGGGMALPLEAGEKVTIKASYSPFSASIDVGLIDEDGIFHYKTVTNGSIDVTIVIDTRGSYTFAIRNNSKVTVDVSGYISY